MDIEATGIIQGSDTISGILYPLLWAEAEVATEDDSSTVEPSTANIVVTNRYFFIYPRYIITLALFLQFHKIRYEIY